MCVVSAGVAGSAAAATAANVALATTLATVATTVYSQRQQTRTQEKVLEHQAEKRQAAAKDAQARGRIKADEQRKRTLRLISEQRAGFAASGVELDSGSTLDTTSGTAALGELDALTIENNAAREAYGYQSQAETFAAQAGITRQRGRANTTSTILTGAAQGAGQYYSFAAG